jgi:hypothetical protein
VGHRVERQSPYAAPMSFLVVVLVILIVVGMLLWLGAIADAADYPSEDFAAVGRTKRSTITFIAVTLVFGGIWYWLAIRGGLRRAARTLDN